MKILNLSKTYSELVTFKTFEERFEYLRLFGSVGKDTFGHARYLNQSFYRSREWKDRRNDIIVRDYGCDLAMDGYEISDRIIIHHLNPVSEEDLINYNPEKVLHPENLVCVSPLTHEAIHYSDKSILPILPKERRPGDTKLW